MRPGSLATVTVATLLAIGVTLAASIGSTRTDGPAISKVTYIRDIDHRQPERLGDCPLSQWVTVEQDGALLSIWYLQRRQNGRCVPLMDFEDASPASEPDAPDVAARSSIRLTPNQVNLLHEELGHLRWKPAWGSIEDIGFPPTMSSACDRHFPRSDMSGDDYDTRLLVIERSDNMAAALTFFSAREARRAGERCNEAQSRNIARADAAIAPYVRGIPKTMKLPPNRPELLEPKTLYLTD
jgi:hypothetical protein